MTDAEIKSDLLGDKLDDDVKEGKEFDEADKPGRRVVAGSDGLSPPIIRIAVTHAQFIPMIRPVKVPGTAAEFKIEGLEYQPSIGQEWQSLAPIYNPPILSSASSSGRVWSSPTAR